MKKLGFLFALIAVLAIAGSALAAPVIVSIDIPAIGGASADKVTLEQGSPNNYKSRDISMYLGEKPTFVATVDKAGYGFSTSTKGVLKFDTAFSDSGVRLSLDVSWDIKANAVVNSVDKLNFQVLSADWEKDEPEITILASFDANFKALDPIANVGYKPGFVLDEHNKYSEYIRSKDVVSFVATLVSFDGKVSEDVKVFNYSPSEFSKDVVASWDKVEKKFTFDFIGKSADLKGVNIVGVVSAEVSVDYEGPDKVKRQVKKVAVFDIKVTAPAVEKPPVPVVGGKPKIEEIIGRDTDLWKAISADINSAGELQPVVVKGTNTFMVGNTSFDAGHVAKFAPFTVEADAAGGKVFVKLEAKNVPAALLNSPDRVVPVKPTNAASRTLAILTPFTGTNLQANGNDGEYTLSFDKTAKTATMYLVIGDWNGTNANKYDLDKTSVKILDPILLGIENSVGKKDSSSGGGCTAAYAPFALILAAPLFFLRKKD